MANLFLDKVDTVPLFAEELSPPFEQWLSVLVDTLNENISRIEGVLGNGFQITSLTTAEITVLSTDAPNGTIWYCTDHVLPCLVAKINNVLVQIATIPFP